MGNQYQSIVPSKLNYITLLSHRTNDTELTSTVEFNTSGYDDAIGCL